MEEQSPYHRKIGKVEVKKEPLAIDPAGQLEQRASLHIEGIDPQILKATFGGKIENGNWKPE